MMGIFFAVLRQHDRQSFSDAGRQLGETTVEVTAIAQVKPAVLQAHDVLRQANRVGKGHQHNFTSNFTATFQLSQFFG